MQSAAAGAAVGVITLFEHRQVTHWAQATAVLVIGSACYLRAVAVGGASRASALFSSVPPGAALLAWPLLGETPTPAVVLGIALGAASCVLGTRPDRGAPAVPVRPLELTA
ncbi:EamA family transporter [Saccharopolyspora sp. NPDC002376]